MLNFANKLGKKLPIIICFVTVGLNLILPFSPNSKFATDAGKFGYWGKLFLLLISFSLSYTESSRISIDTSQAYISGDISIYYFMFNIYFYIHNYFFLINNILIIK